LTLFEVVQEAGMTVAWRRARGEFEFDGSWRDLYALGTDLADWQRLIDALRNGKYEVTCSRDGNPVDLPIDVRELMATHEEIGGLMSVTFSGITANCHFFTTDEIEFDIDPREVNGEEGLQALFGFMKFLASAISKVVVMTPENTPDHPIFRAQPGHPDVEYHPPRMWWSRFW
jgi:hypothetical protein